MSQFFSENQKDNCNSPENKLDSSRNPYSAIGGPNNLAFSPASEQNNFLEGLMCPSIPSPLGSTCQPFSPFPMQLNFNNSEMCTPLLLSNFSRNQSGSLYLFDSQNGFKVPLKIDQIQLELTAIPPSSVPNPTQTNQTFSNFSSDSRQNLKQFLNDQLCKSSVNPPDKSLTDPKKPFELVMELPNPLANCSKSFTSPKITHRPLAFLSPTSISTTSGTPSQSHPLQQASAFIYKAFTDATIDTNTYASLPKFESDLIYYLLKRKFQPKSFTRSSDRFEVPTDPQLANFLTLNCNKRPEECYKFVLTRVIKSLKHRFEAESKTKAKIEEQLYEKYFKSTANKLNISLVDFHYPLTGTLKGKFKLNSVYFARIFHSEIFVREVQEYCKHVLIAEYSKDISRKLEFLFSKWSEELSLASPSEQVDVQKEILNYVKFNKRCKLPWTLTEVRESIDRFNKMMSQYIPPSFTQPPSTFI